MTKLEDAGNISKELVHRVKNLLTVVRSLATQTARNAPDLRSFLESYSQRLSGLAQSADLLTATDGLAVAVDELARRHLLPFVTMTDGRVIIEAAGIALTPDAVQPIGMAFHELATNALKHGALGHDNGRLQIAAELIGRRSPGDVQLTWHERHLSILAGQLRGGFGRRY